MVSRLHRQLLIRTFESGVKRRRTFRYLNDLKRSQWKNPTELRELQLVALRNLVRYAAQNCRHYSENWSQLGLKPSQIAALADFERWPLVDRETICRHRNEMKTSATGEKLISKATGGSSGVPLQFFLNPDSNDRRMAAWHRGYAWAGAELGTRQVYLWGVPLGNRPWRARWKDYLYERWLYRRQVLNTFDLSDQTMPEYLRRYNQYKPEVLVAYTNPLYVFARWLEDCNRVPYSPRSIVVGAEKLHPFQRELIERVFRAPVFETYGSREFMLIGAECDRHEGLHLTMEHLLVEVVDDEGRPAAAGEEGQVVITDLYNYGMPFIRYITGDRAVAGFTACRCGRGLPLLRKVVGRQLDILTTPSGKQIPGEFFPHLIKDFALVRRFQVIQPAPDEIVLKLVVDKNGWSVDWRNRLQQVIERELGKTVNLAIQEVENIPLTAAGKLRVVVNECRSNNMAMNTTAT